MRLPSVRVTTGRLMIAMAVIAIYLASYRALVSGDIRSGAGRLDEFYIHAPQFCGYLFAPANRLDRVLRPRYWAVPACVY